MSDFFMLVDGEIVPTSDIREWGEWMKDDSARRIALTELGFANVSTVFLGIDHSFALGGDPVLFETMIFGGEHDNYQERYRTLEEARAGHDRAIAIAKGEVRP